MDIKELLLDDKTIAAIDDGSWEEDFPEAPGLRLKVRGWSSQKVMSLRSAKERRVSRKERDVSGNILPEVQIRIVRELVAEAVLLEWDGLTDGGKPVPYSKELARKWLNSRTGDRLLGLVSDAASRVDNRLEDTAEDLEKN